VRAVRSRRNWAQALRAAVVLAGGVGALVLPASAAAGPHAVVEHRHGATYAVGMRSYTFVDRSRPTSANGSFPGAPTRTLPTLLLYPAVGDPNGPAGKDARPIRSGHGSL
jgi:hypothetical protein